MRQQSLNFLPAKAAAMVAEHAERYGADQYGPRPALADVLHYYPEFAGTHEANDALPAMSDFHFALLTENIRTQGLANDLVADSAGLLVDGRHRLLACYLAGKDIRVKYLRPGANVWAVVEALNVAKKCLSDEQICEFLGRHS